MIRIYSIYLNKTLSPAPVLNTWDNNNIKSNLKLDDDELLKQLENCDTSGNDSNCFLPINNSEDSLSESDNDFILNMDLDHMIILKIN